MRVCVYGAGASGGHFAVKLALAGHDVSVVARGPHLDAIRRDGLRLDVGTEQLRADVAATDDARELGVQDVVIVAVKTSALRDVAPRLGPLVGDRTQVVFAQNGMPWWYRAALPAGAPPVPALAIFELAPTLLGQMRLDQVVGAVIYTANSVVAPGVVRNNSPAHNALAVGPAHVDGAARIDALRALLDGAGIASPPVVDIRADMWAKLIGNASYSSVAVLTGDANAVSADDEVRIVFERCMRECLAVAAAHGHPVDDRVDIARWGLHRGLHKPSMLQDFEAGRPMEIAEMVLAPRAFGRSAGIVTPTLDALAGLSARLAAGRGLFDPARA